LLAYTYRHSLGYPHVYPDNDLGYGENFMNMLWKMTEPKYQANPEQNCSANAMRAVGSSQADPSYPPLRRVPLCLVLCTVAPTKKFSRC
jgi:citrate synthase